MKYFFALVITFLISVNYSFLFAQKLSEEERKILELQDLRSIGENEVLINFLNSPDADIQLKAIYALANISDSNSVIKTSDYLTGILTSPDDSDIVSMYSFFLGQTPGDESKSLLKKISNSDYKNLSSVFNSTGIIGSEEVLDNLTQYYLTNFIEDIEVTRAIVMSAARFALRKIKNEKSVEMLKYIADVTKDIITQRNLAFALWRTGDKILLENAKEEIYTLAESEDAQTRMWAFNAMGKLQDIMLLEYMLESFGSEKDWRVKVNMLNSLTNYNLDSLTAVTLQLYSVLGDAIGDTNEHVSLTALNVLGKLFSDSRNSNNTVVKSLADNIKEEFVYGLDSVTKLSWRQKSELANSMSLIYKDEVKEDLFRAFSNTDNYDLKSGILKAFGNFDDGMIYKEVRDTLTAVISRYNEVNPNATGDLIGSNDLAKLYRGFTEMLSNLDEKVDEENQNTIRLIFTEFVSSKDPVITDICLTALKDSLYLKYKDETTSVIGFDYNELQYPKDYDVMLIFIDAMKEFNNERIKEILVNNLQSENYDIAKSSALSLETITGQKQDYSAKARTDFDWEYIESLPQKKTVTLKTNKGEIKIELLPEVAPFTVMNFLKLAENNYYDGTIFHRVVSNFVIQGGDPTGTGYGGPGYTIRSEFSPLSYETGMVGMASSGKDTEGSQFFITHSATPHLDGKYTIFGKVINGMDVVNNVMIGDYIDEIIIE